MNVLLLNYEYPPLGGGAGNATRFLLQEFSERPDLSIDVVTSSDGKKRTERFSKNVTIHFLNIGKNTANLRHQSSKDLLAYAIVASRFLSSLLRQKPYDLCHAFFTIPCGYLASRLHLPYLLSLRGSDVPGHNPKFRLIYRLLRRQIRKALRDAACVVANSGDLAREARATLDRPYQVIPNGVDLAFFQPAERHDSDFRVLYAGRLHRVKNLDQLIRGYSQFAAMNSDQRSELLLAGDGPERHRLKTLSESVPFGNRIRFLGNLSKEELRSAYQHCSVFTLISKNEGMSNALLEAAASGLAIVATNTGGVRDLLGPDVEIVNPGDAGGIAEALSRLDRDRSLLAARKQASRAHVLPLNWSAVADRYLDLYRRVASMS